MTQSETDELMNKMIEKIMSMIPGIIKATLVKSDVHKIVIVSKIFYPGQPDHFVGLCSHLFEQFLVLYLIFLVWVHPLSGF